MVSNIVSKKWSPSVTRRRKPHDPAIISFDALPARDGQTERQKDRQTDGYTALAKSLMVIGNGTIPSIAY